MSADSGRRVRTYMIKLHIRP